MRSAPGLTPPFSPVLLAGLALRPVPLFAQQAAADAALAVLRRRHRRLFERLDELGEVTVLIDPIDLPVVFVLRLHPRGPSVTVGREAPNAAATVRGALAKLIELLEGRSDGDALFFSRDLAIEGRTEIVVALRNALDAAEIDLAADLLSVLGPMADPATRIVHRASGVFGRMAADLDAVRDALLTPLGRRLDAQTARIDRLEQAASEPPRGHGRAAPARAALRSR